MATNENGAGTALVTRADDVAHGMSAFEGNAGAFEAVQRAAKALASSTNVPVA